MKKLLFVILASLSVIKTASCDQLRDFRVTGIATCMDPNFAFFYDNQNPCFNVTFKNSAGEIKTRGYQADITSWGLKLEFDIKLNIIMFVNTNLNFEESNQELHLGTGIDLGVNLGALLIKQPKDLIVRDMFGNLRANPEIKHSPLNYTGLALTYAPFKNAQGGLLIIGARLGLQSPTVSIVTSGSLKPLA